MILSQRIQVNSAFQLEPTSWEVLDALDAKQPRRYPETPNT